MNNSISKNNRIKSQMALSLFVLSSFLFMNAQQLEENTKVTVLNELIKLVGDKYVDEKIALIINDSLKSIQFEKDDVNSFRKKLTKNLRKFSNDKHFRVFYDAKNEFSNTIVNSNRKINYGFEKIEILKGNIGYLKISYFEDPAIAGSIARSALSFLSNADGIIIDLRDNNGGRKSMVQLILSFFFHESSKHLFDIKGRQEVFHGYTETHLQEKKLDNIPIYVLINKESFSAAEMFAFILQKQNRATLIGIPTAGGGHTVGNYTISNGFSVNLPVGKVIDPVTKEGWEKIGVKPDVKISNENEYIKKAHLIALKSIISQGDVNGKELFTLNWIVDILSSTLKPTEIEKKILKSYVGTYGRRIISYSNGNLYYQGRAGIDKAKLIAIDNITFRFDEVDFFRVQFILDEAGKPKALKGLYDDQFEDITLRNR